MPSPAPSSTETLSPLLLDTARSGTLSPLRSPIATANGEFPAWNFGPGKSGPAAQAGRATKSAAIHTATHAAAALDGAWRKTHIKACVCSSLPARESQYFMMANFVAGYYSSGARAHQQHCSGALTSVYIQCVPSAKVNLLFSTTQRRLFPNGATRRSASSTRLSQAGAEGKGITSGPSFVATDLRLEQKTRSVEAIVSCRRRAVHQAE